MSLFHWQVFLVVLCKIDSRHLPYAPVNRKFFEVTDVVLITIILPVTSIVAGTQYVISKLILKIRLSVRNLVPSDDRVKVLIKES